MRWKNTPNCEGVNTSGLCFTLVKLCVFVCSCACVCIPARLGCTSVIDCLQDYLYAGSGALKECKYMSVFVCSLGLRFHTLFMCVYVKPCVFVCICVCVSEDGWVVLCIHSVSRSHDSSSCCQITLQNHKIKPL